MIVRVKISFRRCFCSGVKNGGGMGVAVEAGLELGCRGGLGEEEGCCDDEDA